MTRRLAHAGRVVLAGIGKRVVRLRGTVWLVCDGLHKRVETTGYALEAVELGLHAPKKLGEEGECKCWPVEVHAARRVWRQLQIGLEKVCGEAKENLERWTMRPMD